MEYIFANKSFDALPKKIHVGKNVLSLIIVRFQNEQIDRSLAI